MEKPKLTLVYVDGASQINLKSGQKRILRPEELTQILDELSAGGKLRKKVFLDDRGNEQDGGREDYNQRLIIWEHQGYKRFACPRLYDFNKESIDPNLIEEIHSDVDLLNEFYSLRVVLVFGDSDYRSVISALLEMKIAVSLIFTTPNVALQESLTNRCGPHWSFFETDRNEKLFRTLGETSQKLFEQGLFLQASFTPQRYELGTLTAFHSCTYTCPECGELVTVGHHMAHPCTRSKNPPPGLMTKPFRLRKAAVLTTYSMNELLDWCVEQHQQQVEQDELMKLFDSMAVIRWDIVQVIQFFHRITAAEQGLLIERGDRPFIDALNHAGIIESRDQRLFATEKRIALATLIEEVASRTHYRNTSSLYSPDGASKEDALRDLIVNQLISSDFSITSLEQPERFGEEELWDSNTALTVLTNPNLQPAERAEICQHLHEIHAVNQWSQRLEIIRQWRSAQDILEAIETIVTDNPFMTEQSLIILVKNGLLRLHDQRQTLSANQEHVFFFPFERKAVA
jgi:hypothetical protein